MKSIIHLFHILTLLLIIQLTATAQTDSITKRYNGKNGKAKLLVFDTKTRPVQATNIENKLYKHLKLSQHHKYKKVKDNTDRHGNLHYTYQQYYKGIKVEFGIYKAHSKNGMLTSVNGDCYSIDELDIKPTLTEAKALAKALETTRATKYMWEIPEQEQWLKQCKNDHNATYFPKGEIVICEDVDGPGVEKMHLTYKFNIFVAEPLSREDVYVDAHTGEIVFRHNRIAGIDTQVPTKYNGTQTIVTEKIDETTYRLRDYSRGDGIETFDLKQQGYNYLLAEDYTDSDNNWSSTTTYQAAFDAQWGVQVAYDYFLETFGRNSFDGNGTKIQIYTNAKAVEENARFILDSKIGIFEIGNGGSNYSEFASIDFIAHEFGHGVTFTTANLNYWGESGALNEGFSDIWAACISLYSGSQNESIWEIGENLGATMRNMKSPEIITSPLGLSYPNKYKGLGWYEGTADMGGVHHNSTVLSHWFYLLAMGNNEITGLGIDKSAALCYNLLCNYLTPCTDFWEIRNYSIKATQDSYGNFSTEMQQVVKAWQAVGIGDDTMFSDDLLFSEPEIRFGYQANGAYTLTKTLSLTNNTSNSMQINISTGYNHIVANPNSITIDANSTVQMDISYIPPDPVENGEIVFNINQSHDKVLKWTLNGKIIRVCPDELRANYPEINFDAYNINDAVSTARDEDIVLVYPGVYKEKITNTPNGKNIKITSLYYFDKQQNYIDNTIIDGTGITDDDLIRFYPSSKLNYQSLPELNGFTIKNFISENYSVIGNYHVLNIPPKNRYKNLKIVQCNTKSIAQSNGVMTIESCVIENCMVQNLIDASGEIIINNSKLQNNICSDKLIRSSLCYLEVNNSLIINNETESDFIYFEGVTAKINNSRACYNSTNNHFIFIVFSVISFYNTVIDHNTANRNLIHCHQDANVSIQNTTISDNTCLNEIQVNNTHNVRLLNSIIWNKLTAVKMFLYNAHLRIEYSDIKGGRDIVTIDANATIDYLNNIDANPLFCDTENGDYSLQKGSPCIDTGDPNSPQDPDMSPTDIGRYSYNVKEDLILHAEIYADKELTHYATNSIVADDVTHVHEGGKLELYCDNSSGADGITLGNGFHAMYGSDFLAKSNEPVDAICLPQEEIAILPFSTGTAMLKSSSLYITDEKEQPKFRAEETEIGITVFPNPTNSTFSIRIFGIEEGRYRALLFNPLGSVIIKKIISGTRDTEFDISSYPAGVYIVKVITSEKVFAKHVVKY